MDDSDLARSTSTARSDSFSSLGSSQRPSTSTELRTSSARESTWREEQAALQHQLRLAKAEIANLQGKLGLRSNSAPFNTSSPRKSSVATEALPLRRSSSGDLASSAARRRSTTPDPEGRPAPSSNTSPRSAPSPRGPPPLPEGAGHVAMNRALLSDDAGVETLNHLAVPTPSPYPSASSSSVLMSTSSSSATDRAPSPSASLSPSLRSSNGLPTPPGSTYNGTSTSQPRSSVAPENPFFGSGASRERLSKSAASAQSGSGKVISGLQSDLLQARSALESTRGQLRLSQRAVEFLGRQTEDLKETKDRLSLEIDGLNRQLTRKERLQEEALSRARVAETALKELQTEHRNLVSGQKEKIKGLEESTKRAEDGRVKSEREYASLREGIRSMSEGWRSDLKWLKEDLAKSEKELEFKASSLSKLLSTRTSLQSTVTTTLSSLQSTQTEFIQTHSTSTSSALKQLTLLSSRHEEDAKRAQELKGEFGRLRRRMVEYAADGEGAGSTA
ncbi:hypothetical protein JCM11641_004707 [Rhodosporidiobolus odoratus]